MLRGGAALLRALGLVADGPVLWGTAVASRRPGVFVVERAAPAASAPLDGGVLRRWIERVPGMRLDGEPPTQGTLASRLAAFWHPDQTVLYVGRTAKALGPRVAAMYVTPLGSRRPHPGGHWLKTLADLERLRLWWAETDAPEEYEDAVLGLFAESLAGPSPSPPPAGASLPWAVLEWPTGLRKATGIEAALVDQDTGLTRVAAAASSSMSGQARRRAPGRPTATAARPRAQHPRSVPPPPGEPRATHLTAAGLASLREELDRLVRIERPAVIERVKHARELGDLRENAEYHAAREEQSFLEGRIRHLDERIRTAVIIEGAVDGSVVIGSTVTLEHDGERSELTIVGSTEADPAQGRISQVSPVGRALLGHRAGDEVVVRTPGHEARYRIVEVR
jgi:transcription elongation factor GreA